MDNLRIKQGHKETSKRHISRRGWHGKGGLAQFLAACGSPLQSRSRQPGKAWPRGSQGQDVWANIWCAVLADGGRVPRLGVWCGPGPEVLLSLLPMQTLHY